MVNRVISLNIKIEKNEKKLRVFFFVIEGRGERID